MRRPETDGLLPVRIQRREFVTMRIAPQSFKAMPTPEPCFAFLIPPGLMFDLCTKQTRTAKKMLDEMSGAEVAAQFGVSRGTLYRHLGNLKRV